LDCRGFRAGALGFAWIRGLDFLGFPWILSSESGLFNGLLGLSVGKKILLAPSHRLTVVDLSKLGLSSRFGGRGRFRSMVIMKTIIAVFWFSASLCQTFW
jgi:hypothetical protein